MFQSHFGLRRRPFPSSPDLACYYPATTHEQALHQLVVGLEDDEGILLLTGAPGTGKTLLCQCLLDRLGDGVHAAFLTHTHLADRAGLLQAILFDLSLPHAGKSEQELRLALIEHLVARFADGKRTVLVIDEAHHLGADLLEELRLLGNLEGETGKAVQVVLVGQPELLETMAEPALACLRQRLAIRPVVEPLDVQEAADYLLHHLRAAGGTAEEIIDAEALELIARQTGGVPRLMNQVAHQALRLAVEADCSCIDVEVALEALGRFGLAEEMAGSAIDLELLAQEPAEVEIASEEPAPAPPACRLFIAPARSA